MATSKKGELLRGYKLLEDFKIVGGGTCQWTFATKDGGEFFIKKFLDPRLPAAGALGSEEVKQKRRERCRNFERHQRDLMERVRRLVGAGGNLVAPIDFFEHEGYYYKIARKVTVTPGAEKEISGRLIQDRITLCINVCSAIQSLHSNSIVHGDLKLDNILLQKGTDGGYLAKVIDFDSSYVVGSPPPNEEILGDPPYYSPELLDFIQGRGAPASLTTASDIFSLGIVFCEYMTGSKPVWTGKHNYLAEAVRADERITIPAIPKDDDRGARLTELISQMISKNAADRPGLFKLKTDLITVRDGVTGGVRIPAPAPTDPGPKPAEGTGPATPPVPSPPPAAPATDVEVLVKTIKDLLDHIASRSTAPPASPTGTSRLRGSGMSIASPAAAVAPDNSATIEALRAVADQLKELSDS